MNHNHNNLPSETSAADREGRSIWRILDASLNRCREGLRVVEDYARFHRNNAGVNRELKQLRHDLQQVTGRLDTEKLLSQRDTPGDVGTGIQTAQESSRASLQDVAAASCKRVEEALRSLEEYSKLISPETAGGYEQLRYRFYGIEQQLFRDRRLRERIRRAQVYFLLTEQTCRLDWKTTARQAVEAGVDVLQLREKTLEDRKLLERACWLRELTAGSDTLFIMNDRPDLALLAEADGVHVGQEELRVADIRRVLGTEPLVGVSTHSIEQARQAVSEGADYIGVGPTFPSTTKEFTNFPGLEFVRQVAREIERPWFAIGGIRAENLRELVAAGGTQVAFCQVISQAEDLSATISLLKAGLSGNNSGTRHVQ